MQIRKGYFWVAITATLIVGMCMGVSVMTLAFASVLSRTQHAEQLQTQPQPQTGTGGSQHGSAAGSATGSAASGTTVNVTGRNFAFSLDATEAKAGTITFVVKNEGSVPHDFEIRGSGVRQKTNLLDPGETESLTVDLQPGTYTYVCTVPGHDSLGMKGSFTVVPASE